MKLVGLQDDGRSTLRWPSGSPYRLKLRVRDAEGAYAQLDGRVLAMTFYAGGVKLASEEGATGSDDVSDIVAFAFDEADRAACGSRSTVVWEVAQLFTDGRAPLLQGRVELAPAAPETAGSGAASSGAYDEVTWSAAGDTVIVVAAGAPGKDGESGLIDDAVTSPARAWSSEKAVTEFQPQNEVLDAMAQASSFGQSLVQSNGEEEARAALGVDQIDNTPDADKPVSAAQQTALNAKAPLLSPGFSTGLGINLQANPGVLFAAAAPVLGTGTISNAGAGSGTINGIGTRFLKQFRRGMVLIAGIEQRKVLDIPDDTHMTTEPFTAALSNVGFMLTAGPLVQVLENGQLVFPEARSIDQFTAATQIGFYNPLTTINQGSASLTTLDLWFNPQRTYTGTGTTNTNGLAVDIEISRTQAGNAHGFALGGTIQPGVNNTADWTYGIPSRFLAAVYGSVHGRSNASQNFAGATCFHANADPNNGFWDKIYGYMVSRIGKGSSNGEIRRAVGFASYQLESPIIVHFLGSSTFGNLPASSRFIWDDTGLLSELSSLKVTGAFGINGKDPQPAYPLPAALPTDGSATNAQIAAAFNALRALCIADGLGVAA